MEVLNYKKCSNNLYNVCFDNGEKFKLYEDVIIEFELLIDKKITNSKLKKILEKNELLESYYKALRHINIKMRTEKEIIAYLKKYDFNSDAIDFTINKLKTDGYLNEKIYVQAYINDAINLSNDGPKKILNDLTKLGIDEDKTLKYLTYNNDFWQNRIKSILNKKAKTNKNSYAIFKNKMYTQLILLGYDTDLIKNTLDNFKLDTSDVFKKEADKIWSTLEKKYDKNKIIWQFRNKMYSKGYKEDEINSYIDNKKSTI